MLISIIQHVIFPNLKILRIPVRLPREEILMKFLENNGKNLNKLDIRDMEESLCLLIIQLCLNLKEFYIEIEDDGLKIIFESCKHLESIN